MINSSGFSIPTARLYPSFIGWRMGDLWVFLAEFRERSTATHVHLTNLERIKKRKFTLFALPIKDNGGRWGTD